MRKTEFPYPLAEREILSVTVRGKPGFFKRIGNFFRGYGSEMKKIVWYPFKDVVRDTGVVMVCLVASGVVIGVLDLVFTKLILFLGQIG